MSTADNEAVEMAISGARLSNGAYRDRILARVCVNSAGCWEWRGKLNDSGYGRMWFNGRGRRAHAVAYELWIGPIPEGLELDHKCRNRACANPAHLEPVTRRENLLRGATIPARNAAKTCCPRGHAYAGENLWVDKMGRRNCKTCQRSRDKGRRRDGKRGNRGPR